MIREDELVRRLAECGQAAPVIRVESRTVVAAARHRRVLRSAVIAGSAVLAGAALFAAVALAQPWSRGPVPPAGGSPTPSTEATAAWVEPDPLLGFQSLARSFLEDPALEMSDAQRAMVGRALDAGEVPWEDYRAALDATFACFDASGVSYFEESPTDGAVPVVTYSFEGDAVDAADACLEQNSSAIESLYQTQPSAQRAAEASFEAALPQLVACMREGGYLLDVPEPTTVQVREAIMVAVEDAIEDIEAVSGPEGEVPFPIGCLDEAGIDSF